MGLFSIFKKDPQVLLDRAQELFDHGEYGAARLAFAKARRSAANEEQRALCDARMAACALRLATARVDQAQEWYDAGQRDRALAALEDASEISDDPEVAQRIAALQERWESAAEESSEDAAVEMTDDELFAVIAGTWSPGQAQEFALWDGEALRRGLLAAHDGRHDEAVAALGAVDTAGAPAPYLWMALARSQEAAGDGEGALATAGRFLEHVAADPDWDDADAVVAAHFLEGRVHAAAQRFDEAEQAFLAAYNADPDNYLTALQLGVFLRGRKQYDRALRALERARDSMGTLHPDMVVYRELGLTALEAGNEEAATGYLRVCYEYQCKQGRHLELDPAAMVPLATVLEKEGNLAEACDIYRHLAAGYDAPNRGHYALQAARLLLEAGDAETADAYLEQAAEEGDAAVRAAADALRERAG